MDIIDRYVHAVGQHLPGPVRADVEAELRSLLAESLEERAAASGTPPTEALARDVVREFGPPREVAARYSTRPQYLIGPPLFPVYVRIVKIQLAVVAGVSLFMLITGFYARQGEAQTLLTVLGRAWAGFFNGVANTCGVTTVVFALIELAIRRQPTRAATWDPAQLPAVDDPDRVSFVGKIVWLYLVAVVAVVFNYFPEWVGVVMVDDGGARAVPLLEPAFRRYLPLLNAWWAVAFILTIVVLRNGRRTRTTRWWEVGLDLFNAAICAAILLGPPVFRYDQYAKLGLAVFLAVTLVRAAVRAYRLVRSAPGPEPWKAASVR
jgi:hypothetical protein